MEKSLLFPFLPEVLLATIFLTAEALFSLISFLRQITGKVSGCFLGLIFFDADIAYHGGLSVGVRHVVNGRDMLFDNVDFLQGRYNKQLQVKPLKHLKSITCTFV